MHNYKELKVWQHAMELAKEIYRLTADFPKEEIYGLTSQLRRAAVSVPANIAEGSGRESDREFSRFLSMASGSCAELETLVELSARLGMLNTIQLESIQEKIATIGKMLYRLRQSKAIGK